jgi:hypothetical protein
MSIPLPCDLYFTYIRIRATAKNALVCKHWHVALKYKLKEKKIQHYDTKIYEIIINKLYSASEREAQLCMQRYFDNILRQLMMNIINDKNIKDIIKKNMIEYYKTFISFYNKYRSLSSSSIELQIAEEYKNLLGYYDEKIQISS